MVVTSATEEDMGSDINTVEIYGEGTYRVINSLVGYVDYDEGSLMMDFNPTASNNDSEYIYFSAKPRINDILGKENSIITIDSSDVTVTCIDDTDRINENKTRSY